MQRAQPSVHLGPHCPPGAGNELIRAWAHSWVGSAALADLLAHFGGPSPSIEAIDDLCGFASSHWDFRHRPGDPPLERHELVDGFARQPATVGIVLDCAESLGLMSGGQHHSTVYDHIVVLGGRAMACITRSRLAARIVESGVSAPEVVGITAARVLDTDERTLLAERNLSGPSTEAGAMTVAMHRMFRPERRGVAPSGSEPVSFDVLDGADRPELVVVESPPRRSDGRRATTAESLSYWVDEADLPPERRVLIVTGAIFVPYQGVEALRTLSVPHGHGVDVVGLRPRTPLADRRPLGLSATYYLQEIAATLHAIRELDRLLRVP